MTIANNEQNDVKKIKDFFWNGVDVNLEDGLTYREVRYSEFDNLMEELYGYGIFDIEALVMDLGIGMWADSCVEEDIALIELFYSFVRDMS